jgi:TolB-like protein/tRNA A-37 threonylcarbamoyl transferase component Bud32
VNSQVSRSDPLIGETLGHYRITEQIGSGGMGVVYRAHDGHLDREVAIKVLPLGTLADESVRRRFRNEALALSKLNHPNIATIHDFASQQGLDFLVMEYIPGVTLADRLAEGSLPEKQVIALGIQLAEGLSAAHEQAVVHRDLKPANLRLTTDGRLKVLDFGLAKLRASVAASPVSETLTLNHALAGTLPYMAPEQLLGGDIDARTDIHAAGAVLYEMSTGHRAFPAIERKQLAGAILQSSPRPADSLNPRLSPELTRIIGKCLEKEPDRRYQSAKELAIDLRRLQEPTSAARMAVVGGKKWKGWKLVAAGIVVIMLAAIGLGFVARGVRERFGRPTQAPIQSLAVLPLESLSHDPEQDYFADGMTEELTTELSQIASLRVISRTSAMRYKGSNKPLPEIAHELNVDGIIEGSVLRSGDRVRITAQLIQGSSDTHLWAKSYERDLRDVLVLQSEVARAIASEVQAEVTPQAHAHLATRQPVNTEAYALYLRGRALAGRETEPDNRAAIAALERATAIDPNFALAYAALGHTYSDRLFGFEATDEVKRKAEAAIEKALSLDPTLAEAHVSRATLLFTPAHGWQYEEAIQECQRALTLDPNLAEAHLTLAGLFLHVGLLDEAFQESRTAASLSPALTETAVFAGFALAFQGKFQDALLFLRSLPPGAFSESLQIYDLWELGRKDEAWDLARELLKEDPEEKSVYLACVHTLLLADSGPTQEIEKRINEKILKQAEGMKAYGHFHHVTNFLADIYAQLNQPEQAVAWLEQSVATGFPCYPFFEHDRALDPIRQDPHFLAFMQKLRPQWESLKSTYGYQSR